MMMLDKIRKAYFIGIGGIGMSAIARYFNFLEIQVEGYDRTETELTRNLENEGIKISYFEDVKSLASEIDLVVYTPAIPESNLILSFFRENDYPIFKRAEVLGLISKDRFTIAIAGTHGKTTTSAMVSYLLKESGVDCTCFVGGLMSNYQTNFLYGDSQVLVVEADEFDRSFLHLHPDVAVLTSMDADHLDVYESKNNIENSFREFVSRIPKDGTLIYREGLNIGSPICKAESYGWKGEKADWEIGKCSWDNLGTATFEIRSCAQEKSFPFKLGMPGKHNVENALAAKVVFENLKAYLPEKVKAIDLEKFTGIKRRFEYVLRSENLIIVDDYAHHPTEIKALLESLKILHPGRKISVIFQPHLFSRTRDFAKGFGESLSLADEVFLLPIYPAREEPIQGVTSELIKNKLNIVNKQIISKNMFFGKFNPCNFTLIAFVGAGDIDVFMSKILAKISD